MVDCELGKLLKFPQVFAHVVQRHMVSLKGS